MNTARAALYIRCAKSTEMSTLSLDSQSQQLQEYCRQRNWGIVATYQDVGQLHGTSGLPGLQQLYSDVRAREFDVLVVYDLNRFARTLKLFWERLEFLTNHRVRFVSVRDGIDGTTRWSRLILPFILFVAKNYSSKQEALLC